jgi:hypothetical protein
VTKNFKSIFGINCYRLNYIAFGKVSPEIAQLTIDATHNHILALGKDLSWSLICRNRSCHAIYGDL